MKAIGCSGQKLRVVVAALLVASALGACSTAGGASHMARAGTPPRAPGRLATYGRLPLAFAPNLGQSPASVRYSAGGAGYALALTESGASLSLREGGRADVVGLRLVGGLRTPALVALARLPGTSSYFLGSDRSRWRSGVPTFARVRYRAVWPGISVDFYGRQTGLEYDLRIAPGSNPAAVGLRFAGAHSVRLTRTGSFVVRLAHGVLVQHAPVAYQVSGTRREPIAARFKMRRGVLRLVLGAYDHARKLIVDPGLAFSTYLGGSGTDIGRSIAVDSQGSAYVTGTTTSTNFPTQNPLYRANAGSGDVFITKLNPSGTALVYSTYLGGSGEDDGNGIAVDSAGDAYVTGQTTGTSSTTDNFPTTAGAYQATYGGNGDAFLAKLDPSGTALLYSTYLGSANADDGSGIAVSGSDAYVTGSTRLTGFPTTTGAYQSGTSGCSDFCVFVSEINTSLSGKNSLVASTLIGTFGHDEAFAIALDSSGDVYVTGDENVKPSGGYPTTSNAYQSTNTGSEVAILTELNPGLTSLIYSSMLGGSSYQFGYGIAVTSPGIAYITGYTVSTDFPTTTGAYQTIAPGGGSDAFVAEFDTAATTGPASLVYSSYLGGNKADSANAIAVDSAGDAWVTGSTSSTNFPTLNPLQPYGGQGNAFVTELNPAGSGLLFSTFLGGTGGDLGTGIALDGHGYAYVTGQTGSSDLPTQTPFQALKAGAYNAFVAKIGPRIAATSVSCAPSSVIVGSASTCTATVTDTAGGQTPSSPSGTVSFSSDSTGAFGSGGTCTLASSGSASSSCSVSYTPSAVGTHHVTATYGGDSDHAASSGTGSLAASAPVGPPGGGGPPPGGGQPAPPVLSAVTETARAWREGTALPTTSRAKPPVGTKFAFALNEPASVRFVFSQQALGRRVHRRCVAPSRHNAHRPRCSRTLTAGRLSFAGHSGANVVRFAGRLSSARRLQPGSYTLTITATNSGRTSAPAQLRFTIVKG